MKVLVTLGSLFLAVTTLGANGPTHSLMDFAKPASTQGCNAKVVRTSAIKQQIRVFQYDAVADKFNLIKLKNHDSPLKVYDLTQPYDCFLQFGTDFTLELGQPGALRTVYFQTFNWGVYDPQKLNGEDNGLRLDFSNSVVVFDPASEAFTLADTQSFALFPATKSGGQIVNKRIGKSYSEIYTPSFAVDGVFYRVRVNLEVND